MQDDFNGDGRSDILWRNDNGSLAIWTMNGTAVTSGNNIASSPDATWHVNGVGDYLVAAKADILWRTTMER